MGCFDGKKYVKHMVMPCQVVNGAIPAFACLVFGASVAASVTVLTSWHRFGAVFWWCVLVEAGLLPLVFVDHHVLGRPLRYDKDPRRWTMGIGVGQVVLTKWLVVGQYRAGADEFQKKNLGKRWVKFYQCHRPPINHPWPGMVPWFESLKNADDWMAIAGSLSVNSWAFLRWWAVARHLLSVARIGILLEELGKCSI